MKYILALLTSFSLLLPALPASAMTTPIFSIINVTANTGATRFFGFGSGPGSGSMTGDNLARVPVATAGSISDVNVITSVAPGVGASYTFTLFKNGSATSLVSTVSGASTAGVPSGSPVSVAAGDTLSWQEVPAGPPAATNFSISCSFTGTVSGESILVGGSSAQNSGSQTFHPSGGITGSDAQISGIVPTAGTIDQFYVDESGSLGASNSLTYTVILNGVNTAIQATTTNTTTTANDLTHSISVVPGDTISIQSLPTGTPTARTHKWGLRFRPTIDGESITWVSTVGVLSTSLVRFTQIYGKGSLGGSDVPTIAPVNFTLKKMYTAIDVAPTGVKTQTIRSRVNSGNGNLVAVITGAAVSNSDLSNSDSLVGGTDLINWSVTPSGSPPAPGIWKVSAVSFIPPSGAASTFSRTIINGARFILQAARGVFI